jgi:hypothetical protein
VPFVVGIDRGDGARRNLMYKPGGALTVEDYVEVKAYVVALAHYEARAAKVAAALMHRFEGEGGMDQREAADDADLRS